MAQLEAFLQRAAEEEWDFFEVLTGGVAAGWSIGALLPFVEPYGDWTHDDRNTHSLLVDVTQEDWVEAVIVAAGSIEAAQAAVNHANAPACWGVLQAESPIDVRAHFDRRAERQRAREHSRT